MRSRSDKAADLRPKSCRNLLKLAVLVATLFGHAAARTGALELTEKNWKVCHPAHSFRRGRSAACMSCEPVVFVSVTLHSTLDTVSQDNC